MEKDLSGTETTEMTTQKFTTRDKITDIRKKLNTYFIDDRIKPNKYD